MNTLQRLSVLMLVGASYASAQDKDVVASNRNIPEPTLLATAAAPTAIVTVPTANPLIIKAPTATVALEKPSMSGGQRDAFFTFMAAEHGAALLDAWSTRDVLRAGGRELDPIVRPFAHSPTLYPALQVAPFAVDYFATRMMRSNHRLFRATWWVPQLISAAGSAYCGVSNLGNRP